MEYARPRNHLAGCAVQLTEQIPCVVELTTPRRVVTPGMRGAMSKASLTWDAAGRKLEIVAVVKAHFFGDEELWLSNSRVRIFDRERALRDCFALPRRFGGLTEGLAFSMSASASSI